MHNGDQHTSSRGRRGGAKASSLWTSNVKSIRIIYLIGIVLQPQLGTQWLVGACWRHTPHTQTQALHISSQTQIEWWKKKDENFANLWFAMYFGSNNWWWWRRISAFAESRTKNFRFRFIYRRLVSVLHLIAGADWVKPQTDIKLTEMCVSSLPSGRKTKTEMKSESWRWQLENESGCAVAGERLSLMEIDGNWKLDAFAEKQNSIVDDCPIGIPIYWLGQSKPIDIQCEAICCSQG